GISSMVAAETEAAREAMPRQMVQRSFFMRMLDRRIIRILSDYESGVKKIFLDFVPYYQRCFREKLRRRDLTIPRSFTIVPLPARVILSFPFCDIGTDS
ncbi:hypothetical protein HMPREF3039_00143, partial [Akkermansia sp. KLE1798]